MKRSRVDEVQFGARGGPHRILSTQHNTAGPTIQYLGSGSTLKSNVSDASPIGGPAPTVQYTTYFPYNTTTMSSGNVKTTQSNAGVGNVAVVSGGVNVGGNSGSLQIVNSGGGGSSGNAANLMRHNKNTPPGSGGGSSVTVQQQQQQPQQQQQQQQQQTQQQQHQITPITTNVVTVVPGPPQTPGGGPTAAGQEKFQRLKVEDALSYLDQVKYKFGNQPQVYNDFLDIMKEFKSQSIDTPGVIQRVSNLFKGHPELIVGFNTFLPPGYKIEVQANDQGVAFQVSVSVPSPSGGNNIQLTQPTSPHKGPTQFVHTLPQTVNLITHNTSAASAAAAAQNLHIPIQQPQPSPIASVPTSFTTSRERTVSSSGLSSAGGGNITGSNIAVSGLTIGNSSNVSGIATGPGSGSSTTTVVGIPVGSAPAPPTTTDMVNSQGHALHHISQAHQTILQAEQGGGNQNQPVEFNHAISYVNKIKNRFQSQPEKYKRFLEILHAYQKEQKNLREGIGPQAKTLSEAEVYSQVAKLFDQQDDLLREFGQFLPDASNHTQYYYKVTPAHNDFSKKLISSSGLTSGLLPTSGHATSGTSNAKSYNNASNNISSRLERDHHVGGPLGSSASGISDKDFHGSNSGGLPIGREKDRNYLGSQKFGGSSGPNSNLQLHQQQQQQAQQQAQQQQQQQLQQQQQQQQQHAVKRSPSYNNAMSLSHLGRDREGPLPPKRHKPICRDISIAEASKYGLLSDYAFFDKVRKALRNPEVYDNFLRCLTLFNLEIISKSELLGLISPFLSKFPELLRWFQEFLGSSAGTENIPMAAAQRQERTQGELAQEIDLSTCKRLGASYCALPKDNEARKCSGRTTLCKEVLNDSWASFPTWAEDSTFVTSRKTQYEEIIYRCEDERFELDVVIETNSATIRVLEGVQKRMSRMTPDDLSRFRLDDNLGGNSATIHQRALKRIYGDKSPDIILGMKKNPAVAVGVVLKRLKAKEDEWREAQKGFNKQWREQNEKYYLKSLDHQGINFKQNDIKALRSKSLFNEIETLYDERHEQNEEATLEQPTGGPHLILSYKDKSILEDAANLLIHHVKRQTGIQKQEKTKIKHILRQFVPDLFFSARQQLSDDERDDDDNKDMDVEQSDTEAKFKSATTASNWKDTKSMTASSSVDPTAPSLSSSSSSSSLLGDTAAAASGVIKNESSDSRTQISGAGGSSVTATTAGDEQLCSGSKTQVNINNVNNACATSVPSSSATAGAAPSLVGDAKTDAVEIKEEMDCDSPMPSLPAHAVSKHMEEAYTLYFANNNWYLFLRLHAILCDRLRNMYDRAQILTAEEAQYRNNRRESTATALRLKPKREIQVEDYYPAFLDMLKNVLDGNMDGNNFEDSLREMFGIHAYVAFTLDRVVTNAVRQLQHCVTERGALECVELFHSEQRKSGAGGYCKTATKRTGAELAYQRRAEASLHDENCFKVYIYKIDCRVTIELLDTESDDTEKNVSTAQTWSSYMERLTNPASGTTTAAAGGRGGVEGSSDTAGNTSTVEIKTETLDDDMAIHTSRRQLFLQRNIRRFKKKYAKRVTLQPIDLEAAMTTCSTSLTTTVLSSSSSTSTTSTATTVDETNLRISSESMTSSATGMTSTTSTTQVTAAAITTSTITTSGAPGSSGNLTASTTEVAAVSSVATSSNTTTTTLPSSLSLSTLPTTSQPMFVDPTWGKRPPERIGSDSLNDSYYVDDRAEVKMNLNTYKMVFVMNKDVIFYKRHSLRRAKQTHPSVTTGMSDKFHAFVDRWRGNNVTDQLGHQCNEWFMGRHVDLVPNTTTRLQSNDANKTPYKIFNRYRVERLQDS